MTSIELLKLLQAALRPHRHRRGCRCLTPEQRRELTAELILAQPARTNASIQRLVGIKTTVINAIRDELGAPRAKSGRPRVRPAPVKQRPIEPVAYRQQTELFTGNGAAH